MRLRATSFLRSLHYWHPYTKGISLAALASGVVFLLGSAFLITHADETSIQAGLTIIAEILGVLLGAVLIVVVLLVEQGQKAEEHLRGVYPKFRKKIEANRAIVNKARRQLVRLVKSNKINLNDSVCITPDGPLDTKFRDVVGSLVGLQVVLSDGLFDKHGELLADLDFTEDEQDEYLYGKGALADFDPACFLTLIDDALDVNCLALWCSDDVSAFASEIFYEFSHEGVAEAISNYETSRRVLRSTSLTACIVAIVVSTAGAVMTLLGTTHSSVGIPSFIWIVELNVVGFFTSIMLTFILIQKLFVPQS